MKSAEEWARETVRLWLPLNGRGREMAMDISKTIREARNEALEEAARIVDGDKDCVYLTAEYIRKLKEDTDHIA